MSKTVGLKPLRDFIKYTLYSGFVKNVQRPTSTLIIAEPERGKSTEVRKWKGLGVMQLQDLTSYGIVRTINEMSEEERRNFHHIVVPDLEKLGSRKVSVREEILSMFRIVMDEGLRDFSTGKLVLHLPEPVVLGLVMCTTPEDIGDRRSIYRTLSFQSRLLPFSYDYGDTLKANILDFIETEEHVVQECFVFQRREKIKVNLPDRYARALTPYAVLLSRKLEKFSRKSPLQKAVERNRLLGIRPKENMMGLLKAVALYHGRQMVKEADFEEFQRLYRHMNYEMREIGDQ